MKRKLFLSGIVLVILVLGWFGVSRAQTVSGVYGFPVKTSAEKGGVKLASGSTVSIAQIKSGELKLLAEVIDPTGKTVPKVSQWIVWLTDEKGNKISDGSIVLVNPSESGNLYSALLGILKDGNYNGKTVVFWAQAKVGGQLTNKASFKLILEDPKATPTPAAVSGLGFLQVSADTNIPIQELPFGLSIKFTILTAIIAAITAILYFPAFTSRNYDKPRTVRQKIARFCHRAAIVFLIIGSLIYLDGITNIRDGFYLFVGICYLILWVIWIYFWLHPERTQGVTKAA